jgi:hypothetical protein
MRQNARPLPTVMEATLMRKSRVSGNYSFARAAAACLFAVALLGATPHGAHGLYHSVVIDEVLTSFGGDPDRQFVEMRMLGASQNFVTNSVFAVFDSLGNYVDDILVVPGNVANSGSGTRWLIATLRFQQTFGVAADFLIADRALPVGGGMICFGGGGGVTPLNPPNWDRTNFNNYADCVAYGTYSGPSNSRTGTPTSLNGDGHSLQRTTSTRNNLADFTCAGMITPQNNAGAMEQVPATDPCSTDGTPTETATVVETATTTPTATPTATPGPPIACVADCNESGGVSVDEVIRAIGIALAPHLLETCEQADPNGDGFPAIDELLRAVASSVRGCID